MDMWNLMYLWSLIEDSSKTFQSLVKFSRLGEVKVMSMTEFPTGEWKVGVEPLLRMLRLCWKIRFYILSPLLSEVLEPQRLLCALESIPHMNLMSDVIQWSIACVSLIGRSLLFPAQYADISHITSVPPV